MRVSLLRHYGRAMAPSAISPERTSIMGIDTLAQTEKWK